MQYHNINAGGELDGHSPRWTSPRQTGKGRSRERAALDAPRRSPSPKTAPKQRQTTPRRGEGKVAFKEFDPNLIPDAPRPASRGLSPRGSLAALPVATPLAWLDALPMRPSRVSRFPGGFGCCTDGRQLVGEKAVSSPTSNFVSPWPGSPSRDTGIKGEIGLAFAPPAAAARATGYDYSVQLKHVKDSRFRAEQRFGLEHHPDAENAPSVAQGGTSGAAAASHSADTHKGAMSPVTNRDRHDHSHQRRDGPQQAPSGSPAPEARHTGPVSDIHVPPLKLPSRGAEASHVEGLDHAAADVRGDGVIVVDTESGGMTADGNFARGVRQTTANDREEMPLGSLPQVTTGPWGGRRWIPPSSRHPRRAQVLAYSRPS